MKDFLFLLTDIITMILGTMSAMYVIVSIIESVRDYFKEQTISNLFLASSHIIIVFIILRGLIPLLITFMKGEIL